MKAREVSELVRAFESILANDKTPRYEYAATPRNQNARGESPAPGLRWVTPSEIATEQLAKLRARPAGSAATVTVLLAQSQGITRLDQFLVDGEPLDVTAADVHFAAGERATVTVTLHARIEFVESEAAEPPGPRVRVLENLLPGPGRDG